MKIAQWQLVTRSSQHHTFVHMAYGKVEVGAVEKEDAHITHAMKQQQQQQHSVFWLHLLPPNKSDLSFSNAFCAISVGRVQPHVHFIVVSVPPTTRHPKHPSN